MLWLRRSWRRVRTSAAAGAVIVCAGCGGAQKQQPAWIPPNRAAPVAGPSEPAVVAPEHDDPLAVRRDRRDELGELALDFQAVIDQIRPSPPRQDDPEPAPTTLAWSADPEPPHTAVFPAIPVSPGPVEHTPVFPEPPLSPLTAQDLLTQIAAMISRADELPETAASTSPLRRAVRLAALEAVEPGVASAELARLESELLPSEAAVFKPLRELLVRLGSGSANEDPAAIAALLEQYSQRLAQARPLAIPTAVLCESVESFGRYTPLRGTTFAAGRAHAVILYVEVEHFMQRLATGADARLGGAPVGGGEQWLTELGQSLELHHDSDGSLQWRQAEQVVRDSARRRRTDYFLVQRITLPATLSVGKYNLKITVTDKISGATAQARIPIQIVADPSLAQTR